MVNSVAGAALIDELDKEVGERERLLANRAHPAQIGRRQQRVDTALERRQRQHRRRAADESRDAGSRPILARERERLRVAEPARERLPPALAIHPSGVLGMRPDERRRARSAVQVLVAAADRQVGARGIQIDRHRPGGMREVPHHDRAGGVGRSRQGRHVVHPPGAVINMRQHQDRQLVVQLRGKVGFIHQHQLHAAFVGQGLGNVEIGGKVAALRDNALSS